MENTKRQFEKWARKFNAEKEAFTRTLEKWAAAGYGDLHKRGETLYEQAQRIIKELTHVFAAPQYAMDLSNIKSRIAELKKAYKELHESTKPAWRQWIEAVLVALVAVVVLRNFIFGLYHVPTGSAEPTLLVGDRVWGNKMAYRLGAHPQHNDLVMFDNPIFVYDKRNLLGYMWQKYVGFGIPFLGLNDGPDNWVKRVIAVPGDTIEGRVDNGQTVLYRNGEKLDEPYLNPYPLIALEKRTGFIDLNRIGPLVVPDFIKVRDREVWYTYDPDAELASQPYYRMRGEEIIYKPGTREKWLKWPRDPASIYGRNIDEFGPFRIPPGKYWVMGDSRRNSTDSRVWLFLDEDLIHGRASFIIYSIDSEEPFWLFELLRKPIEFFTKHVRFNRFFRSVVSTQAGEE